MNVQEARFRKPAADETSEQLLLDQSPSFIRRTAAVAAVAAADGLHGDPAVFAPCPSPEPAQGVAGQVSEGGGGHAGPEVGAPAS